VYIPGVSVPRPDKKTTAAANFSPLELDAIDHQFTDVAVV
jgi:hypothetical protein